MSSRWTKEAEKEVLTLVQTFEAEGKKVDFNAVTEYLISESSVLENVRFNFLSSKKRLSPNNSLPFHSKSTICYHFQSPKNKSLTAGEII